MDGVTHFSEWGRHLDFTSNAKGAKINVLCRRCNALRARIRVRCETALKDRRDLAAVRIAAHVKRVVAEAPPLSEAQIRRIVHLLRMKP